MPTALLLLWSAQLAVWPPPQHAVTGSELAALAPGFAAGLRAQPSSARLERALARFNARVAPPQLATARGAAARRAAACGGAVLQHLDVVVGDLSEALGVGTDGSYNLRVRGGANATMSAPTIYGAMHGLETFAQLVEAAAVPAELDVADAPDHGWRGLLVDVGRRFAPPPLLRNIIDTMAAVKLNVLHLHLSDFCRFGVQSLRFPALTAALGAGTPDAGFYTQEEVRALVAYGADRGVRIVPEFEVPGHALGMAPIASVGGLEFCSTCAYGPTGDGTVLTCRPSQLWGTNGTVAVLKSLRESQRLRAACVAPQRWFARADPPPPAPPRSRRDGGAL
jgi:hexosaminidase